LEEGEGREQKNKIEQSRQAQIERRLIAAGHDDNQSVVVSSNGVILRLGGREKGRRSFVGVESLSGQEGKVELSLLFYLSRCGQSVICPNRQLASM